MATRGRKPQKVVTAQDEEVIRRLYTQDRLSLREVVDRTGFSLWQVRQAIGDGSRTMSEAGQARVEPSTWHQIIQLRREGRTYDEIATELSVSKGIVARTVREGLDSRVHQEIIRTRRGAQRVVFDPLLIIELSDLGMTKVEITSTLGCCMNTVARARRAAGWKRKA